MKKILVLMMCLVSNMAYAKIENCQGGFFKKSIVENLENFNSKILHTLIIGKNGISSEKCIYTSANVIKLDIYTTTRTGSNGDLVNFDVRTTLGGLKEQEKEGSFSKVNIELNGEFQYEYQNGFSNEVLMKELSLPLMVEIDYINSLFKQRKPVYSDNDFDVYMMVE